MLINKDNIVLVTLCRVCVVIMFNMLCNQNIGAVNNRTLYNDSEINKNHAAKFIHGKVVDSDGNVLAGATILIDGTKAGYITNSQGEFRFLVENENNTVLLVSYIGMETKRILVSNTADLLTICLNPASFPIHEVVITGFTEKDRESFTGSFATYTQSDLKTIGVKNVIQCLRTLDPAINMYESKEWGSDPNMLPTIEIRGKTSIAGLVSNSMDDPNRPLFILDGFEASFETIINLNINRIANVTILKDAASTAIYGAKAANGVIVVETTKPRLGKLRVNYEGDYSIVYPHLDEYNLMNATEKLEFERLSGLYDGGGDFSDQLIKDNLYYSRLTDVMEGANTVWLNEPLRVVLNHSHNLSVDGGDDKIKYLFGLNFSDDKGIMKGSDRSVLGGYMNFVYEKNKKITINNQFSINLRRSEREPVDFKEFSQQNPYYRKRALDGNIPMYLEYIPDNVEIINPLYTMGIKNTNKTHNLYMTDNVNIRWNILNTFIAKARFSISKAIIETEAFKSPNHPDFINEKELNKGRYSENIGQSFAYTGDFNINYSKQIASKHYIGVSGLWTFRDNKSKTSGFSVYGFVDDLHINPSFSLGFKENQKPSYNKKRSRSLSYMANISYSYENRFLLDGSLRYNGTSIFGINNKFTSTWSIGMAWNLHNEPFIRRWEIIKTFKIRGSIGNPGNQNFDAYIAQKTYMYNFDMNNYFGTSVSIEKFGNKNLKMQTTLDRNIGIDLAIFKQRVRLVLDYYYKDTDPMLINVITPPSYGTATMNMNVGSLISKGCNGTVIAHVVERKTWELRLMGNFRTSESTYRKIGNKLQHLNEYNSSTNLCRYYEGGSPYDLWAVPSLGIDPITGREVFLRKDGKHTFQYSVDDQVIVGHSMPNVDGVIGLSLKYKEIMVSGYFRYSVGGQIFAASLFNKVENISQDQIKYNQDKRALYDRWQKPGDKAKFKAITITESTSNLSSRFVVDENTFTGESISIGYNCPVKRLMRVGLQSLSFNIYMNDIFRLSSFKEERGIHYPFAKSISWSICMSL